MCVSYLIDLIFSVKPTCLFFFIAAILKHLIVKIFSITFFLIIMLICIRQNIHDNHVRNKFAREELFRKFDLFEAFVPIDTSRKFKVIFKNRTAFLHTCATCSELPSDISFVPTIFRLKISWIFVKAMVLIYQMVTQNTLCTRERK